MIISDKYKFVYFAPVKTGTSSIISVLDSGYNIKYLNHEKLGKSPYSHQLFFKPEWKNYTTFISVRNPYDRFLSIFNYFSRNKSHETIEDYTKPEWKVKSISEQLQEGQFLNECIPARLDFVVKLESIEEDFNKLPFLKKYEKIPKLNSSEKKIENLSKKIKFFVETKFKEDFIQFNYKIQSTKFI